MDRDGAEAAGRKGATRRAVTAFFDERGAAQAAVDDLVAARVPRERITLVEGGAVPTAVEAVPSDERGLWARVRDLFMADEDRHAYGEGLRRGGCLLSVTTGVADHARVVEILDREGAVDMDARQGDWELEGWDPVRAASDLRAAPALAASPPPARPVQADVEPSVPVGPAFAGGNAPRATAPSRAVRDDDAEGLRLRTYVEGRGEVM